MLMVRELDFLEQFQDMSLVCKETYFGVKLGMLKLTSGILDEIREGQKSDLGLVDRLTLINQGKGGDFRIDENDLRKLFWWPGMKKEIAKFVYSCLICQKSKIEHQKSSGLLQPLTKSAHFISIRMDYPMERLAKLYIEKIVILRGIPSSIVSDRDARNKMKVSQSRQKSYHDKRRKALEFEVNDHVFLRVTPVTGVGRALKSRKLTPRVIGPYQIPEKAGDVAYRITLLSSLANLHDVLHVSQLRRYIVNPSHVIRLDDVEVRDNLTVETLPMWIEDREVKQLRGKEIALVNVIWGGPAGGNMT
ncbi:uncharacterized protein LOC127094602 [Lathyrus oleraceus]|uniref:uncharacterized protein LOC127094602 n=1 Tax=Pisum sativum TaxID=3888 RepID=UPI0021CF4B2A|nr:uncharacterized protein LOC127094602 [Pisum sativum]